MNDGILSGARFITPGMIRRRFFSEPDRDRRPKGGFSGREPRGPKPICWKKDRAAAK